MNINSLKYNINVRTCALLGFFVLAMLGLSGYLLKLTDDVTVEQNEVQVALAYVNTQALADKNFVILEKLDFVNQAQSKKNKYIKHLSPAIWAILLCLVILPIIYYFSLHRPLNKRLRNLNARVESIARGDLSINHPKFPDTDLGLLKQVDNSFTEMSLALAVTIATLKRHAKQVGYSAEQVAEIAAELAEVGYHLDANKPFWNRALAKLESVALVSDDQIDEVFITGDLLEDLKLSAADAKLIERIADDLSATTETVNLLASSFKFDLDDSYRMTFSGDKREYERVDAKIKLQLKYQKIHLETITKDFSQAGFSIEFDIADAPIIENNEIVHIAMFLPKQVKYKLNSGDKFDVQSQLIRKIQLDNKLIYSFQYYAISPADLEALNAVFEYFVE